MFDKPAALNNVFDHIGQTHTGGFLLQGFDELDEGADFGGRRTLQMRARTKQTAPAAGRSVGKHFNGTGTDAAGREIDHAHERGVVIGIGHQPQVGERVLDFLTLEKAQTAVHAIRDARREQRVLDDSRLRIGTIQDGDVAATDGFVDQAAHFFE